MTNDHSDHRPSPAAERASEQASPPRTLLGLVLFALYLLFYGEFVLLNALAPSLMEQTPLAGVNLAVLYGLALIVVAFLLALAYAWLCRMLDRYSRADREEAQ